MAVKTFTTGEVLTAADTNTYLNNGGLVYITQATATSGTSLSINNCFNSTYDNYVLFISEALLSTADQDLYLRFRTTSDATTAYYWAHSGRYSNGTTADDNGANVSYFKAGFMGSTSLKMLGARLDIFQPNLATRTMVTNQYSYYVNSTGLFGARSGGGVLNDDVQYTGFTLLSSSGAATFTSLKVRVYGCRQA